jgi:hypothetical protein
VFNHLKNNPLIYLVLFLFTVTPFLSRLFTASNPISAKNELFKPELASLNSLDKISHYTDSISGTEMSASFDTAAYVSALSKVIKERFRHGSLNYSFSENWIAFLCGKIFWSHLSSVVLPEDILKHSEGLCSQQTIVFMELVRKKNINVRSVGLGKKEGPGHFLCEINYNGAWHLHDVSAEPEWNRVKNHHEDLDYYLQHKDSLFRAYESRMPKEVFYTILKNTYFGKVNEMPARNMRLFQQVTRIITYILPVISLLLFVIALRKKKVQNATLSETPTEDEKLPARPQVQVN